MKSRRILFIIIGILMVFLFSSTGTAKPDVPDDLQPYFGDNYNPHFKWVGMILLS